MDKDRTESKELWATTEQRYRTMDKNRSESKELWTRTGQRVKNYGQGQDRK
jgi:hypothetical protein